MKSDGKNTFGKLGAKGITKQPVSTGPTTKRIIPSFVFLVMLYVVAGLFYIANSILFDGQHPKLAFIQWWIALLAPFVTLYVHFNVPIKLAWEK